MTPEIGKIVVVESADMMEAPNTLPLDRRGRLWEDRGIEVRRNGGDGVMSN